jgi:hypothetical protein
MPDNANRRRQMANKKAGTILVSPAEFPGRCLRISEAKFNADNKAAEDAGDELPWLEADAEGQDSETFDDLDAAGKKAVTKRQSERQAFIEAGAEA